MDAWEKSQEEVKVRGFELRKICDKVAAIKADSALVDKLEASLSGVTNGNTLSIRKSFFEYAQKAANGEIEPPLSKTEQDAAEEAAEKARRAKYLKAREEAETAAKAKADKASQEKAKTS